MNFHNKKIITHSQLRFPPCKVCVHPAIAKPYVVGLQLIYTELNDLIQVSILMLAELMRPQDPPAHYNAIRWGCSHIPMSKHSLIQEPRLHGVLLPAHPLNFSRRLYNPTTTWAQFYYSESLKCPVESTQQVNCAHEFWFHDLNLVFCGHKI